MGGITDRAVKRGLQRRGDAVPTIGLDEKQVFSGHRYFTVVSDPVNHCVFDVITEGRAMKDIKYWFEGREKALKTKAFDDVRKEAQKEITDDSGRELFYHPRMAFLYGAENLPEKSGADLQSSQNAETSLGRNSVSDRARTFKFSNRRVEQ